MNFVHQDPAFDGLLRVVAQKRGLAVGLVEKDYWVTQTLWSLQRSGLELWFKGGTSLSKAHGLLERFSEDLDLKIAAGASVSLPEVGNWKSAGTKAIGERKAFFEALSKVINVPGAKVELQSPHEEEWRNAVMQVIYEVRHREAPGILRPFVQLEIGEARVTPFEEKTISSFVHDELQAQGQSGDFEDNRPKRLRCVHPMVTFIEKLDAISKRFPRHQVAAATFVRHYEDAARIAVADSLSPLEGYISAKALAEDLLAKHQIAAIPGPDNPAFAPGDGERWRDIQSAWEAIAPMHWGPRRNLEECCSILRVWIAKSFA
jgi:hypothetical protein